MRDLNEQMELLKIKSTMWSWRRTCERGVMLGLRGSGTVGRLPPSLGDGSPAPELG